LLGTPPDIRKTYLRTRNVKMALENYERYLQSRKAFLRSLIRRISSDRFCLVCLERDHDSCHRGVIAKVLAEMTGCQPIHLT
jgi:uncharacterized protein (DUF488 family)